MGTTLTATLLVVVVEHIYIINITPCYTRGGVHVIETDVVGMRRTQAHDGVYPLRDIIIGTADAEFIP